MKAARFLLPLFLCLPPAAATAATVGVQNLRLWRAPDHTRLVFDLSGPLEYRLSQLETPPRLVIDMDNARLRGALPALEADNPLLASFRTGKPESGTLRIVLELKTPAKPRAFVLKPAGQYGHRLVIDLFDAKITEEEARQEADAAAPSAPAPKPAPAAPSRRRERIVAIDAGHGGEDPGAIGRRFRTREKDVTLAVARELARLVAREPGMKPVLIRDGDYYIKLGKRYDIARRHRADAFVSIHADALPGSRIANGSSVYALSERGATHALARTLADRENFADLVGGVSLNDKPDDVRKVLVDLSQSKSIEHSLQLGEDVLVELRRVGPVHLNRVAQAGFAVLKAPDIPSVLIETAFISSPSEEKKLRMHTFQRSLAEGIFKGIKRYFARNGHTAPAVAESAVPAPREHVVRAGETLASIARRYNVHVEVLRFLNNLPGHELYVGLRLRLPADSDG
jgi:N-acetylmuramoyl-L-alanine amidase